MALAKENRLKKEKDIKRVLKEGKTKKLGSLLFKFLESNLNRARFAIIVSSKVSKKAVERNKIKRRVSEVLLQNKKILNQKIDGVFVCLPGIQNQTFAEIKETIENILKATKIL